MVAAGGPHGWSGIVPLKYALSEYVPSGTFGVVPKVATPAASVVTVLTNP